jgi:hypothetical protein
VAVKIEIEVFWVVMPFNVVWGEDEDSVTSQKTLTWNMC